MKTMQQILRLCVATLIGGLFMTGVAHAEVKIGFVDMQRLFDQALNLIGLHRHGISGSRS